MIANVNNVLRQFMRGPCLWVACVGSDALALLEFNPLGASAPELLD